MLQAFTENQRQEFDLDQTQLTNLTVNGKIKVLVEMACNETFGNFEDGFMTKTVYDKEFKIKKCQLGLQDHALWNLMCDFLLLADCAKLLDKAKSHVADEALAACT